MTADCGRDHPGACAWVGRGANWGVCLQPLSPPRLDYATRDCCGTTYNCQHLDDCPERGIEARAALPCEITRDGWCATHSTGEGPVYCVTDETVTQLRRARFHERENFQRTLDAEARAERYRLAWLSARRRAVR
jgi:hypothetical protein